MVNRRGLLVLTVPFDWLTDEDSDDGDDDKSSWSPEDYWYWFVPVGAIALIGSIGYCVHNAQAKSNR